MRLTPRGESALMIAAILSAIFITSTIGVVTFIEASRYYLCHEAVEQAGLTPSYDPITMRCQARW